ESVDVLDGRRCQDHDFPPSERIASDLPPGRVKLGCSSSRSGGGDVVDVEGDGGQAAIRGAVGVAAVDAAAGGEGQAVEGLVALRVVRSLAPVGLDGVVQAAEQAVVAEVEDLFGAVGGDAGGEGGLQPTPGLAVLLPRADLAGLDAG